MGEGPREHSKLRWTECGPRRADCARLRARLHPSRQAAVRGWSAPADHTAPFARHEQPSPRTTRTTTRTRFVWRSRHELARGRPGGCLARGGSGPLTASRVRSALVWRTQKAHRNGIKKPATNKYPSMKGVRPSRPHLSAPLGHFARSASGPLSQDVRSRALSRRSTPSSAATPATLPRARRRRSPPLARRHKRRVHAGVQQGRGGAVVAGARASARSERARSGSVERGRRT